MKIICFGDSNTYGWDPREFSTNKYDHQWPELLAAMTGFEVINMGQPGREIYYRDYQFERWLDPYINKSNHDLLIIMLGTNDLLNMSYPKAECPAERMRIFIDHIKEKKLSENIIILSPPQIRLYENENNTELERYAEFLEKLAEEKGLGFSDTSKWGLALAFDGIHLTEDAHQMFADRILEVISRGNS